MKKLLILGASGLVGRAIIDECKDSFDVFGTFFSTTTKLPNHKQFQLGIQEHGRLEEILRSVQPDIVVSSLRGEFNQQLAFHNQLAKGLQNRSGHLYYFSTANVFDGDFSKPYNETDVPVAESDYGHFKIECEQLLQQALGDRARIIRIPAIWGRVSPRMNAIKESLEKNETIHAYSNLECNNLLDTQLAKQLRFIIEKELKGIFHLGSVDMMSQGEFFERLLNRIPNKSNLLRPEWYGEKEKTLYFGLRSSREDIPEFLQSSNEEIISHLVS